MSKYLDAIEKMAVGYDVEEVQTIVEETTSGTKKRVVRTKKHVPPNFQAARYMLTKNEGEEIIKGVSRFDKLDLGG